MIYNVYVPKKVVLPDTFSQATWDEIVYACQKNRVPETWVVGNSKVVYDKYGEVFFTADIIGKAHDDYADGSGKAPITFMTHDLYGELWAMNDTATNSGGWANCLVRTERLPEALEGFPDPIKGAVREVNKLTSAGNASSVIVTTADKLFLVSEIEIYGDTTYSVSGEGTQYDYYFKKFGITKKYGGSVERWWTRSSFSGNSASFIVVNTNSNPFVVSAEQQYGIAFAFCL